MPILRDQRQMLRWLKQSRDGQRPEFCPNLRLFEACKRKNPRDLSYSRRQARPQARDVGNQIIHHVVRPR